MPRICVSGLNLTLFLNLNLPERQIKKKIMIKIKTGSLSLAGIPAKLRA